MRKPPKPDQIAAVLREFQTDLNAGLNSDQACRKAGIGITTYYRWKALQENPIANEQSRISESASRRSKIKSVTVARVLRSRGVGPASSSEIQRLL